MTIYDEIIREGSNSAIDVEVETPTAAALTATYPVAIWTDPTTNKLYGITSAIAAGSKRGTWGICNKTIAATAGLKTTVRIKGIATIASGGDAGYQVTAISASGVVTDTTPLTGVELLTSLGLSLSATTMYIW